MAQLSPFFEYCRNAADFQHFIHECYYDILIISYYLFQIFFDANTFIFRFQKKLVEIIYIFRFYSKITLLKIHMSGVSIRNCIVIVQDFSTRFENNTCVEFIYRYY